MRSSIKTVLLIGLAAFALWAQTTRQPSTTPGGATPSAASPVNAAPQSASLRILTPVSSSKLNTNIVNVRYEVTNPGASAGTPNFLVQLDGSDPVRTTDTQYTFTGLAPGPHTVTVIVVDANDTPISGGRAFVQFNVTPQNQQQSPAERPSGMATKLPPIQAAGIAGPPIDDDHDPDLPSSSSALPLLSVIGFGVLLGGVASAMRTR